MKKINKDYLQAKEDLISLIEIANFSYKNAIIISDICISNLISGYLFNNGFKKNDLTQNSINNYCRKIFNLKYNNVNYNKNGVINRLKLIEKIISFIEDKEKISFNVKFNNYNNLTSITIDGVERNIKLSKEEIKKYLDKIANLIKKDKDIIAGYLFGSYSNDKATNNSDIDLGFVVKKNINVINKAAEIKLALNKNELIYTEIDIICINKNFTPRYKNCIEDVILNRGIKFYG